MSIYTPPPFPHPTRQAPSPPPFSVHATPSHEALTTLTRDSGRNLLAVRYSDNTTGTAPWMERSAWDGDEDEKSERNKCCGMRKRKSWVLLLVIVGVVLGIAVGAGVGVSMMQKSRNAQSSAQIGIAALPSSTRAAPPTEVTTTASFSRFGNSTTTATDTPTVASSTFVDAQSTASPSPSIPASSEAGSSLPPQETPSLPLQEIPPPSPTITAPPSQDPTNALLPLSTILSTATTTRTCPSPTPCNSAGCVGRSNPDKAVLGYCTAGENVGCGCTSVCGVELGICSLPGCLGVDGLCGVGEWMGCPCAAV